ncbi:hypothetical protein M434DRAFT_183549 [Hypoxylon sp. CO27-5]|nr:hypothetical protein M434DRAFT_183549 [Hypoxylon sp. CO27-5]
MVLHSESLTKVEESPFRRALERFKNEHLKGTESEKFQLTDLGSLKDSIKRTQDEQASKNKMRNLTKLKSFLEGMEQYEKLIEVFLNATEYLAFVWGPMKFLLQTTNNFVKAFDAILDMYQEIGEQITVLEKYQALFDWKEKTYMKSVLEMIYVDILDFHAKALSYFRQKAWQAVFCATWNTFRTRFDVHIQNFKRHRRLLENHATLSLFEELKAIRDNQAETVRLQLESTKQQRQDRVRVWLSHEDMMSDQEHYIRIRRDHPGTGNWILKKRLVRTWLDLETEAGPIMWLAGIPGAGKTILASAIIEEAHRQPNAQVIFFYCKDGHQNRNNFLSIARSLLHQLSYNDEHLTAYINVEISKSGDSTLKRPGLAKKLLKIALINKDKVFIVVDGLDECAKGQKKEVVSWLQTIFKPDISISAADEDNVDYTSNGCKVRCLVVSQDDGECSKLLNKFATMKIQLADNSKDIEVFCRHYERKIRKKQQFSELNIPENLAARVVDLSEGMFLFSKLVMENLYAQNKAFRLEEEIQWLEQGSRNQGVIGRLHEAFGRIVRRIEFDMEPEDRSDALQILAWVAIAKRDLGWHEIQGAMSVDVRSRTVDFRRRSLVIEPKELLGSLIELKPGNIVSLVHSSAKHFLIQQCTINLQFEHVKLAQICVCYLSLDYFDPALGQASLESNILKGSYAFYHYAIAHWLDHLQDVVINHGIDAVVKQSNLISEIRQFLRKRFSDIPTERVPESFKKQFNDFTLFRSEDFSRKLMQAAYKWSLSLSPKGERRNRVIEDQETHLTNLKIFIPQLHVTLGDLAKRHRSPSETPDLSRFHGKNLFKCNTLYCQFFHVGFASDITCDSHMKIHTRSFFCNFDGCQYAMIGFPNSKSLEIHLYTTHTIRHTRLVDNGDFPVLDGPSSIDAREAARTGNIAAIQRWAEQFGTYIPRGYLGIRGLRFKVEGVLYEALHSKYEGILLYLLKKVENIYEIYMDVLEITLETPIKLEVMSWLFTLPFKFVTLPSIYELFVRAGPKNDPDIALRVLKYFGPHKEKLEPNSLDTVLKVVSRQGYTSCVRYLVDECKLDANLVFADRRNALTEAAERGHESIIRFLVTEGHCTQATINTPMKGGRTLAELAASNGHQEIIRMLSTEAGEYQRLLGVCQLRKAAIEGDTARISSLLECGDIPIDNLDIDFFSPFLRAVENGRTAVVDLLLSYGKERININQRCICRNPFVTPRRHRVQSSGATALIIACVNGYKEIVEILLRQKGIEIHVSVFFRENRYSSKELNAKQIADHRGFVEISRLLDEAEVPGPMVEDSKGESRKQAELPISDVDFQSLDGSELSEDDI